MEAAKALGGSLKLVTLTRRGQRKRLGFVVDDRNHFVLSRMSDLRGGYNYDPTSIRRPFDCLSKVIEVCDVQ